ncbi:MAG: hypothetical protein QM783_07865 [Phycisphaerales bacterium]
MNLQGLLLEHLSTSMKATDADNRLRIAERFGASLRLAARRCARRGTPCRPRRQGRRTAEAGSAGAGV